MKFNRDDVVICKIIPNNFGHWTIGKKYIVGTSSGIGSINDDYSRSYSTCSCCTFLDHFEIYAVAGSSTSQQMTQSIHIKTVEESKAPELVKQCQCKWVDVLREGCRCGSIKPYEEK